VAAVLVVGAGRSRVERDSGDRGGFVVVAPGSIAAGAGQAFPAVRSRETPAPEPPATNSARERQVSN